MIKALENTAIKIDNESDDKLFLALAGLLYGEKQDSMFHYQGFVCYTIISRENTLLWSDSIPKECKLITLSQLAWDYGLAPDWAVDIYVNRDGYFAFTDGVGRCRGFSHIMEYLANDWSVVLTRKKPELKSTTAFDDQFNTEKPDPIPESSPRKTLQDALEAYPDGWPSDYFNFLHYSSSGWTFVNYQEDVRHGKLVCTKEEFEAEHKPQWPAKGSLPPVGVKCELLYDDDWEEVIYHGKSKILKRNIIEWFSDGEMSLMKENDEFRPIQSERDMLIEQALKLDCEPQYGMLSRQEFVGAMYDAGWRPAK